MVRPLAKIYADLGVENPRMIYTALHEAFFTYLKLSFWAAVFLSFPVMATQMWMFIAPGLYKNEKGAFLPFLLASPMLFAAGATLVYSFIFPLAWRFFMGFQTGSIEGGLAIELEAKVNAILTPPDIISQVGLGLPILILYEISIVLARFAEKKRAIREQEEEDRLNSILNEGDPEARSGTSSDDGDNFDDTDFNDPR